MKTNRLQENLIGVFFKLREHGVRLTVPDLLEALRIVEHDGPFLPAKTWQNNLELLWGGAERLPPPDQLKGIWETWFGDFSFEFESSETEPLALEAVVSAAQTSGTTLLPASAVIEKAESPDLTSKAPTAVPPGVVEPEIAAQTEPEKKPEPIPDATGKLDRPRGNGQFPNGERRRRFGKLGNPPPILRVRSETPAPAPSVSGVPVGVPAMSKESLLVVREVFAYAPISRLSMAYAWRYLRRPVIDGPADFLDVPATIKLVAHQGFFLRPVYKRRHSNHAHLILLIDQGGSMTPFRSITRDVADTAQQETSIKEVKVFYFHNIVTDIVYEDEYLTKWSDLDVALEHCDVDTSVLIVSDAGAARGTNDQERVEATEQMLAALKRRTPLVTWLNPMPRVRWESCSAEAISELVQMFQMNPDDFSSAIDSLQGRGATS